MTIFEVILALGVFSIAAVALVSALTAIGNATLEARTIRAVEQTVEGIMDEESKRPQIVEMEKELKKSADGVTYSVKVIPVQNLKNQDNVPLQGLFRIIVSAKWLEDGQPMLMEAETMRYAGMFLPVQ
jgi:Na+-translocating ferredoxin:NAD+ oxidoreductase RnfG subunit